jgi:hypothetical protein
MFGGSANKIRVERLTDLRQQRAVIGMAARQRHLFCWPFT